MTLNRRSLHFDLTRVEALARGHVLPDPARCVQCGICSYNCPIGLDVRVYAWRGAPIFDGHCLTCGQCVSRCPRGALQLTPVER